MPVISIEWVNERIRIIDQTQLPEKLVYLDIENVSSLAEAIQSLRVRGAPALGVAAAYGVLLGIQDHPNEDENGFLKKLMDTIEILRQTRPTAVNLSWALDQMASVAKALKGKPIDIIKGALQQKAQEIYEQDRRTNRKLGHHGATLVPDNAQIITHCNTGALATVDYGTALGIIFSAHAQGKKLHIWVDETRPLLQGARLNMWELMNEGVEATLICDNTAAFVMQKFKIDLCLVGADRIARNGDTANKIGTYGLAVAAHHHGIPFYVAAPTSTIDVRLARGIEIPIEERAASEIVRGFGRQTAPNGANVYAPAFDITPHELIAGIITEHGIIRPPYESQIIRSIKNT